MNWSLPDITASSNAEEIYKLMFGRTGLDLAWVSHCGSADGKCIVENSAGDCNEISVDRNENAVARSGRCVERNRRDVTGKESIVDSSFHLTGDVGHSIYQLSTPARKKFAQH